MQAHLRIGSGNTIAPRLHFYDDGPQTGLVYVGHLGPHLRNTLTRSHGGPAPPPGPWRRLAPSAIEHGAGGGGPGTAAVRRAGGAVGRWRLSAVGSRDPSELTAVIGGTGHPARKPLTKQLRHIKRFFRGVPRGPAVRQRPQPRVTEPPPGHATTGQQSATWPGLGTPGPAHSSPRSRSSKPRESLGVRACERGVS